MTQMAIEALKIIFSVIITMSTPFLMVFMAATVVVMIIEGFVEVYILRKEMKEVDTDYREGNKRGNHM